MAVLNDNEILERFKNPNPLIEQSQKEHEKLLMHVHGCNLKDHIKQVTGLENDEKLKLRKLLARSNKNLFSTLLRRTDKIFTAKGGSIEYGIKDSSKTKKLQQILHDIIDGVSLDKWLENIWLDKLIDDPNGFILIEHKDGKPYPAYKSISTVKDYQQNGQGLEYFISQPYTINGEQYIRVYDDISDRTYRIDGEEIVLIEDEVYENPWGYVPATLCSDLVDPITEVKRSPIYEQLEIADEYLRDNTVHILTVNFHGFPMFWQYAPTCTSCGGTGFDKKGEICPVCNGSKHALKKDVSDVTFLKQPSTTDQPTIAPNVAGYITPPIEVIDMQVQQLQRLEDEITYSHWGTIIRKDETERTATEVFINAQPVEDRLNKYSDSYEMVTNYLIDMIGKYLFGDEYTKTSFNAGRNYIVKGITQLTTEYTELKEKNVGINILDNKLMEVINAKYKNDTINLVIEEKLITVEPFVHNTIEEVKTMQLPSLMYMRKIFFHDWKSEQTQEYLFKTKINQLKESLTNYTKQKIKDYGQVQNDSSTPGSDD